LVTADFVRLSFFGEFMKVLEALGAETAGYNRAFYRASGFGLVAAVSITAPYSKLCDVVEYRVEASFVDDVKLAHTGRIKYQASEGQKHQLTMACDMLTAPVACPDLARGHEMFARQGIDQGRFAGAGRADKGSGDSFAEGAYDAINSMSA
jgi:hypothetical protein